MAIDLTKLNRIETNLVTPTGFKISLNYAGGDCQVQYIAFTLKD